MAKYQVSPRFAQMPLNVTEAERVALVAQVRQAIDRDSTDPRRLGRVKRLKRLLARLERGKKTSGPHKQQ